MAKSDSGRATARRGRRRRQAETFAGGVKCDDVRTVILVPFASQLRAIARRLALVPRWAFGAVIYLGRREEDYVMASPCGVGSGSGSGAG